MSINFQTKNYPQLTKEELYELLRLRAEVFIVEQNCVYQDIDNKDPKAIHILGYIDDNLVAYARIFKPNNYFKQASIGRVVVAKNFRQFGFGYQLMKEAIQAIKDNFNETIIAISAQKHLEKFYNNLGFIKEGEAYLEDGIPHIFMKKNE